VHDDEPIEILEMIFTAPKTGRCDTPAAT